MDKSIEVEKIFRSALKRTKNYETKLLKKHGMFEKLKLDKYEKSKRILLAKSVTRFRYRSLRIFSEKYKVDYNYILKVAGYEV
jgi:hypothetical protein